jgi:hypothetical protein
LLIVPVPHLEHEALPLAEVRPVLQLSQDVDAIVEENVPMEQILQIFVPFVSWNLPGGQGKHMPWPGST